MVDQMVLHQQYSLILEVASHHLYPCLGQSHRIVIDDKEVGVMDVDNLMHICIVRQKNNSVLFIIGSHPSRIVEGVAESVPGPSELLHPKLWIHHRSVFELVSIGMDHSNLGCGNNFVQTLCRMTYSPHFAMFKILRMIIIKVLSNKIRHIFARTSLGLFQNLNPYRTMEDMIFNNEKYDSPAPRIQPVIW